jgi:hypothetical protein
MVYLLWDVADILSISDISLLEIGIISPSIIQAFIL